MTFSSDTETIQSLNRLREAVGELYQTCQQRLEQAEKVLEQAKLIQASVAEIQSVHTVLEQIGGKERLNSLIAELNKTHSILVDFPDLEQRLQEKLTEYQQRNLTNQQTSKEIIDNRLEVQQIATTNKQLSDEIQQFHQQSQAIFNQIQGLTTQVEESNQASQKKANLVTQVASQLQNDRRIFQQQINSGQQILNNTHRLSDRVETIYIQVQTQAEQVGQWNSDIQQKVNFFEEMTTNIENYRHEIEANFDHAQAAINDTYLARDEVRSFYNHIQKISDQVQIQNQNTQQKAHHVAKFVISLEASYTNFKEQVRLGQEALKSHQLIRDEMTILDNKIQQKSESIKEMPLLEEIIRPVKNLQITLEQQIELINENLNHLQVNRKEIVNIFHHINEIAKGVEQRYQETEQRVSRLEEIEISVLNARDHIQSMLTEMRSIAMEIKLRT